MNWMKYRYFYFALSLIVILPGLFSLIVWHFRPSVDFTGGAIVQLRLTPSDSAKALDIIKQKYPSVAIKSTSSDTVTFSLPAINQQALQDLETGLAPQFDKVEEISFVTVGPRAGSELLTKTIAALLLTSTAVLLYIAKTFKSLKFGVCATLATLHDTLVMLGIFSLLGHFYAVEVDLLFVTAVLTTISFSVHDTIVVFDRIRELTHQQPRATFTSLVNQAISETLVRSLNNSLTIIFMLIALVALGGSTVRWFSVALLVGAITGTYSSTFTAAPLLVIWEHLAAKRRPN